MKVKLSNGYAEVKDFCPRRVKKELNKIFLRGTKVNFDGKEATADGINAENTEDANDYVLCAMTEKLVLDDKDVEVKVETFDEMRDDDVSKIIAAINKVTRSEVPLE